MKTKRLSIPDIILIEPDIFSDARGFFFESFNHSEFERKIGCSAYFVQDNHSLSVRNVLRGIHYQIEKPQGKLIRVTSGKVFDIAVDLRKTSKTFGQWVGVTLSAENKNQVWIPEGFGHGFFVLSETAEILYKTTDYYSPLHERCIRWDDPSLNIQWPDNISPILSTKDMNGCSLLEAELYP